MAASPPKAQQQQPYLKQLRARYGAVPLLEIPLFAQEIRGDERLRPVGQILCSRFPRNELGTMPLTSG